MSTIADVKVSTTLSSAFEDVEIVAWLPVVSKRKSFPSRIGIRVGGGRSWYVDGGFNWGCIRAGGNRGVNLWA